MKTAPDSQHPPLSRGRRLGVPGSEVSPTPSLGPKGSASSPCLELMEGLLRGEGSLVDPSQVQELRGLGLPQKRKMNSLYKPFPPPCPSIPPQTSGRAGRSLTRGPKPVRTHSHSDTHSVTGRAARARPVLARASRPSTRSQAPTACRSLTQVCSRTFTHSFAHEPSCTPSRSLALR